MEKAPLKIAILFVISSFAFIIFSTITGYKKELLRSDFVKGINIASTPSLEETINQAMDGAMGNYSIYIKNFKTGEEYKKDEHREYDAGSLYKLWIMATVFDQIKAGKLDPEEILSGDITGLNQTFGIPDDAAELTDGSITLTLNQALTQMITISHNYAALLLTQKIGLSKARAFLEANGFKESSFNDPKTTAFDVELFLEKLYRGELVSKEASQEMISLLKGQKLTDGIPKYLPAGLPVANKTGDIGRFKHDAALIFSPGGDYLIVILSESNSPPGAQERIALISKAIYGYFNTVH